MRKFILLIYIIVLFFSPVKAEEPFKLSIKKDLTLDSIRHEAFKNIKSIIDVNKYPSIDPNLIENKEAISNQVTLNESRFITVFDYGDYGVQILEKELLNKGFIYNGSGKLVAIELINYPFKVNSVDELINKSEQMYPFYSYRYSYPQGNLTRIYVRINPEKSYTLNPDGTLDGYCFNNVCYNSKGKVRSNKKSILY